MLRRGLVCRPERVVGTDWLSEAARLRGEGRPFALATVVARKPPQSAYYGAKALILPDGSMSGWIGGGCVRPTILREALEALSDGRPRLVRVSPEELDDREVVEGVRVYPMICQGEGAVDVYIDPVLPTPRLVVFGITPVAEALVRLAEPLGFRIHVVDPAASPDRFPAAETVSAELDGAGATVGPMDHVVVATMGAGDEEALEAALATDAGYVGLVASRKKGHSLFQYLEERGDVRGRLDRVRCPAGLDLGGTSAAEIALSILAQIVELRARGRGRETDFAAASEGIDPAVGTGAPEAMGDAGRGMDSIAPMEPRPLPLVSNPRSSAGAVAADHDSTDERTKSSVVAGTAAITALDPVCGMAVEIATARHSAVHDGRTFHFCCSHCKAAFEREPERYRVAAG